MICGDHWITKAVLRNSDLQISLDHRGQFEKRWSSEITRSQRAIWETVISRDHVLANDHKRGNRDLQRSRFVISAFHRLRVNTWVILWFHQWELAVFNGALWLLCGLEAPEVRQLDLHVVRLQMRLGQPWFLECQFQIFENINSSNV